MARRGLVIQRRRITLILDPRNAKVALPALPAHFVVVGKHSRFKLPDSSRSL